MKLYLTTIERIGLLDLFPRQGMVTTLRQFEEAQKRIRHSEAEEIAISLRPHPTNAQVLIWDDAAEKKIGRACIEIGELVVKELVAQFKKLDAAGAYPFTAQHLALWDYIVDGKIPEGVAG